MTEISKRQSVKNFFRLLFCFWTYMWDYSLFQLTLFTLIQQFLSQIELWQNLKLNESSCQSVHSLWTADEIFDVHLICVWICYLIFYFSKTEAVSYYMCCSLSCSVILTDWRFYLRHMHLVQECCKINFVCFYLNDYCIFYFMKNSMLFDSCIFWLSDFQQFSFRFFCLSSLFSFAEQYFECWKIFLMLIF